MSDNDIDFDAAYKNVKAVRDGKVVMLKKRISGTVSLSPKQKAALAKARLKSHSGLAKAHFAKSMKVRSNSGL